MDNRSAAALIEVERVYSLPISKFLRVIALLRRERYDLLIDSTQWARIGALISAFSGSGRTVGFKTKGEARSLAYDEVVLHSSLKHEWENFASLLQTEAGAFKPKLKECRETERRLLPDSNFVVLHMFASGSYAKNKEWREEYWKMLAEYLAEKGYIAIFTGSESDRERLEAFIDSLPKNDKFINSAGRLNLEELSVLLRRAEGVVSVNTGIMHLAALSGVFTIALHGPSDPARWGGIGDNVVNLTPQGVNSFPAMNGGKIKDESSFARNIKPEEVILALQQALKC
jgi:ADP-heptose:LPS heptosyltransferase